MELKNNARAKVSLAAMPSLRVKASLEKKAVVMSNLAAISVKCADSQLRRQKCFQYLEKSQRGSDERTYGGV